MKTEVKAVIASVVVIALCLAAVGGVTYSWFSDSEQADVEITTGQIELNMAISNVKVQSAGYNPIDVSSGDETATSLGGSVSYTETSTDTQTILKITFNNAAPGDSLSFSSSGTLKNTINVNYRETASVTSSGVATEDHPFTITGLDATAVPHSAQSDANSSVTISDKTVTIKMNEDASNEYMGKSYSIQIVFEAVQANAPGNSISTAVTVGDNNITVLPAEDASTTAVSAGISFTGTADMGNITVSTADPQAYDYTAQYDGTVIAGIDVTLDGGSNLDGTDVEVTFVVQGNISADAITIYHGESQFDSTPTATYDEATDQTTITFTTNAGFSPYFAVKSEAKIGDEYYGTLEEAVKSTDANTSVEITLVADVEIEEIINIGAGKTVTLNLGGFDITSTVECFHVYGNLTINGEGTIESGAHVGEIPNGGEYLPLWVSDSGVTTINGGEFIANDYAEIVFVNGGGKVNIYGGTFRSTSSDTSAGDVLNVSNGSSSVDDIVVYGGTFYNYDPTMGDDALGGNFLATGYGATRSGTEGNYIYSVVKATEVFDSESLSSAMNAGTPVILTTNITNCPKIAVDPNGVSTIDASENYSGGHVGDKEVYVSLDFNGYTITCATDNYWGIQACTGATVILYDSSSEGNGGMIATLQRTGMSPL